MSKYAVDIQNVTHQYGEHTALRDVTLRIPQGALCGLLGPNGSGKTTLFRILSTLLSPTMGEASIFGEDVERNPGQVRNQFGVVFQEPALDERLTVKENLRFHGALYGLRGKAFQQRMRTLLLDFGLAERTGDRVDTLSGGLRRRVDLVRGLLHAPPLLLLDEPTTGLDPVARRSLWDHLLQMRRREGTTLLIATHLMEEAERCESVAILNRGELVAHDSPAHLKSALGKETLWLESNEAENLRLRIENQFGVQTRLIGDTLQISHPEAHSLLPQLYDAFGDTIDSATVRNPTLEDVFVVHTEQQETPRVPAAKEKLKT